MSIPLGQSRPALGQNADLGSLYNARTDSFLPHNIVRANPNPQTITTAKVGSTKVTVIANDSLPEKFAKLDVSNELAASFIAGMIPVSGSGYYLKSTRRSEDLVEGAVLLEIQTEEVKLDLNSPQEMNPSSLNKCQDATHVVAAVTFGAKIILGARLAVEGEPSQSQKRLESQLQKLASYMRSIQTPRIKSESDQDNVHEEEDPLHEVLDSLNLVIFSDFNNWQHVNNVGTKEAIAFINELPSMIATMDYGRGVNLLYTLVPIDSHHILSGLRAGQTSQMVCPSKGILQQFIRVFDQWNQFHRLIHDYHINSEAVYFRCPGANSREAASIKSQLKPILQEFFTLESDYCRSLLDVRSSVQPPERLTQILHQYYTGKASPKSVQLILSQAKEDLDLKKAVLDHGSQYGNYADASNAISTGSNIYVFYFTQESKKDEDSWEANRRTILNLLQRKSDYVVVAAECMPEDVSLSKSRISFYSRCEIGIEDMRESQDYADQSFARYEPKALNTDGRPSPIDRRLVKLVCPVKTCGDEAREWYCYKCRQPLEYCSKRFYCDCGHTCPKSFTWQCNSPTHGTQFVTYDPSHLMKQLYELESYNEQNILLLGETGVGKSTFVNAFYNYILYHDLDDAMSHEKLEVMIPSSFTMQRIEETPSGRKFIQTDIHVGKKDQFEADGTRGDSATQQTGVYRIPIRDTIYRIIDTPGVGDVRGVEADRKNLDNILQTLSRISSLNGIIILLKPNASRLTLTFRFCIQELLTYLHRDAARNIMWGFTNTRQSNYMPGDSYKPLERLLEQHRSLGLNLTPDNVFCFDSESFRYLAAQKQGCIPLENLEDFRRSWQRSADETRRLLKYVSSLQPHSVTGTLCLNSAREFISQLTAPIAEVDDKIQRTIGLVTDQLAKVNNAKTQKAVLELTLFYLRVDIDVQRLDRPRTVCKNPACVDFKDVGGVKRPVYKSLCHDPCYLTDVTEEVVGHADLMHCTAFMGQSRCKHVTCGHHWQEHMHIRFSQEETIVKVKDPTVQDELNKSKTMLDAQQTAIQSLQDQIDEHQKELEEIRNAASQFGIFLKKNSIAPYNDAMIAYLDGLIKEERNLIGFSKSSGIALPENEKRLEGLEKSKDEYVVRIKLLEDQMAVSEDVELLDDQGVDDMVNKLYSLPQWGSRLQKMREVVEWSKSENFREQQFRPKVNKDVAASLQHQPNLRTGVGISNIGSAVTSFLSNGLSAVRGVFSHQASDASNQNTTPRGKKRASPQDPKPIPPEGYATRAKMRKLSTDPPQH